MNRSLIVIAAALAPLCLIPACKRANQPTAPQAATRPAGATTSTASLSGAEAELLAATSPPEALSTEPSFPGSTNDHVTVALGDGSPAAPFRCRLLSADSGKEIAVVQNGKLTQPIAPGYYRFALKRYEQEGNELTFPTIIEHRAGRQTRIAVYSAIELATPRWAGDIFRWEAVYADKPNDVVQWQSGKHAVMLLPPGDYQVAIRPTEFNSARLLWPGVIHLAEDQHVSARLDSGVAPPDELTAFPAAYDWAVLPADAKGRRIPVQHARGSWSPLLVPPGTYRWALHTVEFNSAPVVFPETITVSPGELTTPKSPAVLRVAAGSSTGKPFRLRLADPATGKTIAETRHGAALSPMVVPPGDYDLYCQPQEFHTIEVALVRKLHLPAGQPIDFTLDTGIRIAGPAGANPDFDFEILDATKQTETVIQHGRHTWGTQWLPPGRYRFRVRAADGAPWQSVGDDVTVEQGKVATISLQELPARATSGPEVSE
jgi:hypothetical protein